MAPTPQDNLGLSHEDSTRDRLLGDTEQGLDFIHQRIYAIGFTQSFYVAEPYSERKGILEAMNKTCRGECLSNSALRSVMLASRRDEEPG